MKRTQRIAAGVLAIVAISIGGVVTWYNIPQQTTEVPGVPVIGLAVSENSTAPYINSILPLITDKKIYVAVSKFAPNTVKKALKDKGYTHGLWFEEEYTQEEIEQRLSQLIMQEENQGDWAILRI